jgi:hypothetical protein
VKVKATNKTTKGGALLISSHDHVLIPHPHHARAAVRRARYTTSKFQDNIELKELPVRAHICGVHWQ